MSIKAERIAILNKLRKDARPDMKAFSKRLRMPYQTIRCLIVGRSLGTIKTWEKIERFYERQETV